MIRLEFPIIYLLLFTKAGMRSYLRRCVDNLLFSANFQDAMKFC